MCRHSGQPFLEAFEIGLGFLHLGVAGVAARGLTVISDCGTPLQPLSVPSIENRRESCGSSSRGAASPAAQSRGAQRLDRECRSARRCLDVGRRPRQRCSLERGDRFPSCPISIRNGDQRDRSRLLGPASRKPTRLRASASNPQPSTADTSTCALGCSTRCELAGGGGRIDRAAEMRVELGQAAAGDLGDQSPRFRRDSQRPPRASSQPRGRGWSRAAPPARR